MRKFKIKTWCLITVIILALHNILSLANGTVLQGTALSHLDLLVRKSLRYKHRKQNYIKSLDKEIIQSRLKIKKKPAF